MLRGLLVLMTGIGMMPPIACCQSNEPPKTWPDGWKASYKRFQSFVSTREKSWPSSQLNVSKDGNVTHLPPKLIGQKKSGFEIYQEGHLNLSRSARGSFKITEYFREGDYWIYTRAFTKLGYQHFPPLLHVRISKNSTGEKSCQILNTKDSESHWPHTRGLLYIDFHAMDGTHASYVYEANKKANPSIALKVDYQAHLHRPKLDLPNAERALRWRIYYRGKLKESGPANGEVLKKCNYGLGHHLAFLCIEGPQGIMPVSNFVPYYVYPEKLREKDSLIKYKQASGYPKFPPDYIPGYLGKRPWVLEESDQH